MRFKSSIRNIQTFTKLASSLSSLGKVAWARFDNDQVRFTIIPEQGTQVWAVLSIVTLLLPSSVYDSIFETYTIQSASPNNTINLELPVIPLHRALRSALGASSANLRLTKRDNVPLLSLTIVTNSISSAPSAGGWGARNNKPFDQNDDNDEMGDPRDGQVRETVVTQDIPIRVLSPASVEGIHEPRCREPDVHITLPNLFQLKSISERFTKLATATSTNSERVVAGAAGPGPKLVLSANMHGSLRLSIATDALSISSVWTGLVNPELDPSHVEGGEEGIREHPSTRMKELGRGDGGGEEGWARVRIDGKDWGKVLSVGRLGGRVIACAYIHTAPRRWASLC
ncbi:hypothetical protein GP486_007954 [Trichoglossum hirsutum]|uniref:Checkpoint protein n=1 Tax=Trichoglossum hirsutum TaxID=265104 RepID=A0A9P8IEV9_9PEZI|nr:hypothetical protein GP486_007954 [Trichoglossum hirsutum]